MIFSTNTVVFLSESLKLFALTRILNDETVDSFTKNLDLFKAIGVIKTEKIKCTIRTKKETKNIRLIIFIFFIPEVHKIIVHFAFQILGLINLRLIKRKEV